MAHFKCHFCGQSKRRARYDQTTCGPACNKAFKNLEMTRAKRLYRCLYWWRFEKDKKDAQTADNLRFIAREIRAWIDEDKLAGRPPPPRHDHMMDRGHQVKRAVTKNYGVPTLWVSHLLVPTAVAVGIDLGKPGGDMTAVTTVERQPDGTIEVVGVRLIEPPG